MYELIEIAHGRFGKKVESTVAIPAGTSIIRFTGRSIDFRESVRLGDRESYALQVAPDSYVYLDAPARYFNHSCDPNCGLRPDLALVALRNIAAGEELTYDYSTTMLERKWTMPCSCGASLCRGAVKDFDTLPVERRRYYLARGVVQQFIADAVPVRHGS